MQDYRLKNPGQFTNAGSVRKEVAHAISQLELDLNPEPFLAAFLLDAAQKTPGYVAPAPELDDTQHIVSNGDALRLVNFPSTIEVGAKAYIAGGVITEVVVPNTHALLPSGQVMPMMDAAGVLAGQVTLSVAGGLPSTAKADPNTALLRPQVRYGGNFTITGTGNYFTVTVANGVITGMHRTES